MIKNQIPTEMYPETRIPPNTRILPFVLFSLLFLSGRMPASGQDMAGSTVIKMFANFFYTDPVRTESQGPGMNTVTVEQYSYIRTGYFTPAVSFERLNGDFHEIELSELMINRTDQKVSYKFTDDSTSLLVSGERTIDLGLAFRYEYNLNLMKNRPDARFRPFIGFAASPYFSRASIKYFVSLTYPESETRFGVALAIVPGIQYNINENWFLEFNIPLTIADVILKFDSVDNPVLDTSLRKTATLEILEFPAQIHLRLGAGLRF